MRPFFLVSLIAVLVFFACSKRDASKERAEHSDSAVVATHASGAPIVVREAGLRFDPPTTWPRERYRVDAKSGAGAAAEQAGATHWVALHYRPDQPGHREALLCVFVVFARHAFALIDAGSASPVGTVIESNDAWVWVAQLPQSNPFPPQSLDGTQFDAMRLSIRDVRARFALEGDGPVAGEL